MAYRALPAAVVNGTPLPGFNSTIGDPFDVVAIEFTKCTGFLKANLAAVAAALAAVTVAVADTVAVAATVAAVTVVAVTGITVAMFAVFVVVLFAVAVDVATFVAIVVFTVFIPLFPPALITLAIKFALFKRIIDPLLRNAIIFAPANVPLCCCA